MEELEKITPCISSVSKKGQTVIPRQLRKALGVQEGDHLVWELRGNNIQVKKLTLKEEEEELSLTEAEWKKMNELIREQEKEGKYTTYPSAKAAKTHLSHLRSSVKGGG